MYPISTANPPSSGTIKQEIKGIEDKEQERRRRVVRGNSFLKDKDDWWSLDKVESFYRECCAGREEEPSPAVSAAFRVRRVLDPGAFIL